MTVNHTNDAVNVFDKICYRKGACFLKQIDYYVGRPAMKDGIKTYFYWYSYSNTRLEDFIQCLQTAVNTYSLEIDLQSWVDSWLNKAGVNELESETVRNEDGTYSVAVLQRYPVFGDPQLHEQIVDIALYDAEGA